MADKRFPTDLTNKSIPSDNDNILLSDSDSNNSHDSKITTVQNLSDKIVANVPAVDISGKADKINVLELDNTTIFTPTGNYNPATKKYVDDDIVSLSGSIDSHTSDTSNPHVVTSLQLGLDQVDNTSDINKPVSTLTQNALDLKSDKINVLELDNTTIFTPTGDYNPATKKYVDDNAGTGGGGGVNVYTLTTSGSFVPDITTYNHFDITMNGDLAIGHPAPIEVVGQNGIFSFRQGDIGGYNILFDAPWNHEVLGYPIINTDPWYINVFRYTVLSEVNIMVEFIAEFYEHIM